MDYDMILPAIAGASGIFAAIAVLYSKIRPRCLVTVNCWFCNIDTRVRYCYSDGWMCPSCQQYNGFTEDGDYNRDLPAQYCESLNYTFNPKDRQSRSQPRLALGNGFCQTCNLNQTLKTRALADYTPIHPDNYDQEIEEYRKRLERTYGLCRECEATLHQTLGKQDSWLKPKLISWRLKLSAENRSKLYSTMVEDTPKVPFFIRVSRALVVLISLAILLSNIHHLQEHSGIQIVSLNLGVNGGIYLTQIYKFLLPLKILGLSFVLLAIFGSGRDMLLVSDAVVSFLWVGLLALSSSKKLIPSEDYNSLQVLISSAAVLLTLWTLLVPRTQHHTRMLKPQMNKNMKSDVSSSNSDDSGCTLDASLSEDLRDLTSVPTPHSTPVCAKTVSSAGEINIDSGLESLKISTPLKNNDNRHLDVSSLSARALFSDKPKYNPKLNDSYTIQRNILTPPRLSAKNITQSSWVAGGYWGSPLSPTREFAPHMSRPFTGVAPVFPLSRSSSQSSGYVSQHSGLPVSSSTQASFYPHSQSPPLYSSSQGPYSVPNSCSGSINGDYDRGSVFSEPTFRSWLPPVGLNHRDYLSQCNYSRGHSRNDAQSYYSCGSLLSGSSNQRSPPSPAGSTSCLFHDAIGSLSEKSHLSLSNRSLDGSADIYPETRNVFSVKKQEVASKQRGPLFAFFLGMSIAANGFFIFLLMSHSSVFS